MMVAKKILEKKVKIFDVNFSFLLADVNFSFPLIKESNGVMVAKKILEKREKKRNL